MLSLEKCNLYANINQGRNGRYLNDFIEIFWKEIERQTPVWGCVLVTSKAQSINIIDAICLSSLCLQSRIDYSLLSNLEPDACNLELEIYHSDYAGYVYLILKTDTNSKYLILFSDRDHNLSLKQKQVVRTCKQALEHYFELDRQKELELQRLTTLIHQMGHHLRNHLAEVSIMAETIRLSSTTNFCQTQAEEIQNKVIDLNSDIRKILRIQELANSQNEPEVMHQDVGQVFQTSIDEFKNLVQQKNLKVNYPQRTTFLAIDNLKLKQIFDNLLSNAIHFSPTGGTIDCYWKSFQEETLISICDRGTGLSSEDLRNMFLPSYSRRKEGEGLGLAIVKQMVLDLKGNIWAENVPQGGAKISLVLPKNS